VAGEAHSPTQFPTPQDTSAWTATAEAATPPVTALFFGLPEEWVEANHIANAKDGAEENPGADAIGAEGAAPAERQNGESSPKEQSTGEQSPLDGPLPG
jgi:hypothetical protein